VMICEFDSALADEGMLGNPQRFQICVFSPAIRLIASPETKNPRSAGHSGGFRRIEYGGEEVRHRLILFRPKTSEEAR